MMIKKNTSISDLLTDLSTYAHESGDKDLQKRVRVFKETISDSGGDLVPENITGSNAVSISSDIQIFVRQERNLPEDLLMKLMNLAEALNQRADANPQPSRHIKVFLASPGDVKDERHLALNAIRKIGGNPFYKDVTIEALAWDKPNDSTPMLAGMDPQQAISEGLGEPAECDICVVIFWSRMGTPLDHSRYQKADGSQYFSGTEWELENALNGYKNHGRPLVLLYRRTEEISLFPSMPDFKEKVRQWKLVQDFFNNAKNPDGSIWLSYNTYATPSAFGNLLELHLRKLLPKVIELQRTNPEPSPERIVAALSWPKNKSPFPGLRAFEAEDAPVFFGRGLETDILIHRLAAPNCRFLAVVGASGSGKSSLVGAGLLPRLKGGALPDSENWPVARFTPDVLGDGDPFNALIQALSRPPFQLEAGETSRHLRAGQMGLREIIEEYFTDSPANRRAIFFIDQFEELFTRVKNEDLRREFFTLLSEATNSSRILMVVTMRDDFYQYCVKSPILSRLINRNTDSTFTLSAPGPLELYEMITGPARIAGLQFDAGLARQILDDTGSDPGAIALMAYALDQLYKASDGQETLTLENYESFGCVQGAIGTRAQEIFDKLPVEAQETLPLVFRELLDVDESGTSTRKRATLEDVIQNNPARNELVLALTDARLLVISGDEHPIVEVAHEALFSNWPRLKTWIEASRNDLILLHQMQVAAKEWNRQGRPDYLLWPAERLDLIYAMKMRLLPDLSPSEQDFIRPEQERLLDELQTNIDHPRREEIGTRLSIIGDTRPGVGLVTSSLPHLTDPREIRLWGNKPEHEGLPDIVWLPVSGTKTKVDFYYDDYGLRTKYGSFTVKPFYISKYPITYVQYRAFIYGEKSGFSEPQWWEGLAVGKKFSRNVGPSDQRFKGDNYPADNICWYDAIAFCRWLNSRVGMPDIPNDLQLTEAKPGLFSHRSKGNTTNDYNGIRLPAEWEWQWAASGEGKNLAYPFGSWDYAKANTKESGLNRNIAVGMYPSGMAPCGAMDLSGNIWEWCINERKPTENTGLSGNAKRAIRGGLCEHDKRWALASYRYDMAPGTRNSWQGFRLLCRLPNSL